MRRLPMLAVGPMLAVVVALTACGTSGTASDASADASSDASSAGRPTVVAAFAPLAEAARAVGGDAVRVQSLTPPGVEPHDLELSATQVADLANADLVVYVKGFQPAVDEAIAQQAADRALDVSAGLTLLPTEGTTDPHVWLAPRNMASIADAIRDRLAAGAPDAATNFTGNASAYADRMRALDSAFADGLANCRTRTMVVSHAAFGYLADAYGLTQVGISGLSPEAEPSPARIAAVADAVRADAVSTIYYETLVDPKVAKTLADEVGVATAVLDPIESLADGTDYETVMRANLATLKQGQGCS